MTYKCCDMKKIPVSNSESQLFFQSPVLRSIFLSSYHIWGPFFFPVTMFEGHLFFWLPILRDSLLSWIGVKSEFWKNKALWNKRPLEPWSVIKTRDRERGLFRDIIYNWFTVYKTYNDIYDVYDCLHVVSLNHLGIHTLG